MNNRIQHLKNIFHSTFLPVHYYKNGTCQLILPNTSPEWDLTETYRQTLIQTDQKMTYVISNEFLYYGIVRNFKTEEIIIVGPVLPAHAWIKKRQFEQWQKHLFHFLTKKRCGTFSS